MGSYPCSNCGARADTVTGCAECGQSVAKEITALSKVITNMQFRSKEDLPLDAWLLGAAYRLDAWQFKATIARNQADTGPKQTVHQRVDSVGVSRTLGAGLLLTTAWYKVRREASGFVNDGFDRAFVYLEKALGPRTTIYAEADYTSWRGNAAGLSGTRPNDSHGAGLTFGLMQKF